MTTKEKSSLKKDTVIYGAAMMFERVVSFFMLPMLTKTLEQELYGVWTQIVITSSLLSTVVLFGFHSAAVRFIPEEKGEIVSGIFHKMSGVVMVNSIIVVVTAFFLKGYLSYMVFGDIRFSKFVPLLGFLLASEALFDLTVTAFLRAKMKILVCSIYYIIKSGLRVGLLAIGIIIYHDLYLAIVLIVFAQLLLTAFIYFMNIIRDVGFHVFTDHIKWKEIIFFSLPVVPYGILVWLNNFISRYFILHIFGINHVSIYAVAYSISAVVGIFYVILGFTLYPHIAKLWNSGDKSGASDVIAKGTSYFLFFAFPFAAIFTVLNVPIIKLLTTTSYLSSWHIFFLLGAGHIFFGLYQLNIYSTFLAKRTVLNLIILCVALIVNTILNLLLIPKAGILGAALAAFLTSLLLAFWTIIISKRILSYRFPWNNAARISLATVAMSGFILITKHFFDVNNLYSLALIVVIAMGIYTVSDISNKNSLLLQLRKSL